MSEPMMQTVVNKWKEARALLQQSLEMYESGRMGMGEKVIGSLTEEAKERVRRQIAEFDALINEYSTQ